MQNQITCPACGAPIDPSLRFEEQITCPFCGTQSYIGESTKALSAETPQNQEEHIGEHATLAMVYTRFKVGANGTITFNGQTHNFTVYGRLQYEYAGGYWSEWYLGIGDAGYWLQEDEGVYILYLEQQYNIEDDFARMIINSIRDLSSKPPIQPVFSEYTDPAKYQQDLIQYQQELQNFQSSFDLNLKVDLNVGHLLQVNDQIRYSLLEHGRARMVAYEGNLPTPPNEGAEIYYFDGVHEGSVYSLEIENAGQNASLYQGWPLEYEDILLEGEPSPKGTVGATGV